MSQIIQIIDRRIAKFSIKDAPLKPTPSTKDLRSIKLDPLAPLTNSTALKPAKTQLPASTSNVSIKSKPRKVKTFKTPIISHKSSTFAQKPFVNTENPLECFSVIESNDLEPADYQRVLQSTTAINVSELKSSLLSDQTIRLFFNKAAEMLKNKNAVNNYHWWQYQKWRKVMKKGVRRAEIRWISVKNAALLIQSCVRMFHDRKNMRKIKQACVIIQKYWKDVWGQRKRLMKIKRLVKFLKSYAKARFLKKTKASIIIQKHFRGFLVYKKYKKVIYDRIQARKHRLMLERQATLVKERNIRKNSVKVIEKYWMWYKEKLRMKEIRKYLYTLPYECRLLYLKFKQVKQDADNLKNDVDMMIANKKSKSNFEY